MQIGFVNFSQDERNKLYQVMQMIRDSQAIDELGIGRIRDAFSNKMFPGMSTLHNRAKYYAVLPSIYLAAENGQYKSPNDVRKKIIDLEIKLTRQLILGSAKEDQWGITGSTIIDKAERNADNYVKYDPTYIYSVALFTFGMVNCEGGIYNLIKDRSKKLAELPTRLKREEEEFGADDLQELSGLQPLFDGGGLKYVFDGKTPINIKITKEEAKFIKNKIEKAPATKGTLLRYILCEGLDNILPDYQAMDRIWSSNLPDELYLTYKLSLRFANFVYLLRLVYNYAFNCRKGNPAENNSYDKKAEELHQAYIDFYNSHTGEFTKAKIDEILLHVSKEVTETYTIRFCRDAASLVEQNTEDAFCELMKLIEKREKQTKGSSRSKLLNPEKYDQHIEQELLNYRWGLVYSVLNEIKEALNHE